MPTPIDAYLAQVPHPLARKTLSALRAQLAKLLPTATETLSYGMPAFRLPNGKVAAGFAFFTKHCGYYPHSGRVVARVKAQLVGFGTTPGGVAFPPEKPLPLSAVKALVAARLEDLGVNPGAAKQSSAKQSSAKQSSAKQSSAKRSSAKPSSAKTSAARTSPAKKSPAQQSAARTRATS